MCCVLVGDWAGASFTDPANGCSGTCADHVLDPNNFYVSSRKDRSGWSFAHIRSSPEHHMVNSAYTAPS